MIKFSNVHVVRDDMLDWCFPLKSGAMMVVVPELLEQPCLLLQVFEAGEELAAVEHFVKDILKLLNGAISPGFSRRYEDDLYTQGKAYANHESKR